MNVYIVFYEIDSQEASHVLDLEVFLANMPSAAKVPFGAWALVQPAVATDSDSWLVSAACHWSVRARGSRATPRGRWHRCRWPCDRAAGSAAG